MAKHQPKHRAAKHRGEPRKGSLRTRSVVAIAAPVAATVTVSVVGLAVQATPTQPGDVVVNQASLDRISERAVSTSRSAARTEVQASGPTRREVRAAQVEQEVEATEQAVQTADDRQWTTTELNIWTDSTEDAEQLGTLDTAEKVLVTGRSRDGRDEVVLDGESRWVTSGYLSEEKPAETGLDVECTNGSTIATPVSPNIVSVHQVVCGNFPDITTYGTLRSDGEHGQGLAIDIMVSGDRGWEVAEFLKANYAELGINYLIYSQQIWSVERSSEGWRAMEDRGSTTANHYDHVHVTTY